MVPQSKGRRRILLDFERIRNGEPKANFNKNRDLNCRFPKDSRAFRKKGRDRFKCGKKRRPKGKVAR
jgi:hypothetical protein